MNRVNDSIEIVFPKLGHFWLDSGLVGLIQFLREVNNNEVKIAITDEGLKLTGSEKTIQIVLESAYNLMTERYYNLSTKKQRDNTSGYNFYYDSQEDKFVAFPKRKAVGIAALIYDKAPRPTASSIKWERKEKREIKIDGKKVRKARGILPTPYVYLQERLDSFLDKNGLDVTTAGLLKDGPNAVRPKIKIQTKSGKPKGICYLCGEKASNLEDANQTIFPLITGTSGVLSFNPQGGDPEKVCWKCSLLGKFVPVNGFYLQQGNHLYIFLPYSVSLEKMLDVFKPLHEAEQLDPNLFRNFEHPLGGYFQRSFEVTFAFLFTLYKKVLLQQKEEKEETTAVLDWERMLDLTINKSPLEFIVLDAESKGQTTMVKRVWPFRDTVYFFRLMNELKQEKINIREVMRLLVDFSQKKNENKTLLRNRICERILKKQTILDLVEMHVFRAELDYFKPLLNFLVLYEKITRRGGAMTKEDQEVAVTLGRRVGMAVGKKDKQGRTSGKKGDLFALRKARKKTDFLEQLNRLQFKLGSDFTVPKELYEGALTDSNFVEFKQFCMIAALNSFNAATKGGENK